MKYKRFVYCLLTATMVVMVNTIMALSEEINDSTIWNEARIDHNRNGEGFSINDAVIYTQGEYYSKGAVFSDEMKDARLMADTLEYILSLTDMKIQNKVTNAVGARAGFLVATATQGLYIGGAVAYIEGPKLKTTIQGVDPQLGPGNIQYAIKSRFQRYLLEAEKSTPLTKNTDLKIKGGLGYSYGWIEWKAYIGGSLNQNVRFTGPRQNSNRWSGATWELSPSVVMHLGESGIDVELGANYISLPSMRETPILRGFSWAPVGYKFAFVMKGFTY